MYLHKKYTQSQKVNGLIKIFIMIFIMINIFVFMGEKSNASSLYLEEFKNDMSLYYNPNNEGYRLVKGKLSVQGGSVPIDLVSTYSDLDSLIVKITLEGLIKGGTSSSGTGIDCYIKTSENKTINCTGTISWNTNIYYNLDDLNNDNSEPYHPIDIITDEITENFTGKLYVGSDKKEICDIDVSCMKEVEEVEEVISITLKYGISENGPWHSTETDIIDDLLPGDTVKNVYVKATASTNRGSIQSMSLISGSASYTKDIEDGKIFKFTSNQTIPPFRLRVQGVVEQIESTFKIEYVGSQKAAETISDITSNYGISEKGPWYAAEGGILNDLYQTETLEAVYVKVDAVSSEGAPVTITVNNLDESYFEYTEAYNILKIKKNTPTIPPPTITLKGLVKTENTSLRVSQIGVSGNKNPITLTLQYGLSQNGNWYDTEDELKASSEYKNASSVSKIYVKAVAKSVKYTLNETLDWVDENNNSI